MSRSTSRIKTEKPLGGRYKVVSQLGIGGFGRTYLAEDLHLPGHPRCVLKQLKPRVRSEDTLSMARRCFEVEAQVLYRLGNHDQIPRLLAHFEEEQEFFLAQEFIEGESLTQELVEGKPWSEGRTVALLKDILQVLAFVHQQQVIHRDLKPSNLIRRRQDHKIVVIDFGAVKQVSAQSIDTEAGTTNLTISIGTQGYMPNEQLAGKPRFSSDIYAVGVLGVQALTGVHPKRLGEDTRGELEWRQFVPDLNAELADVIDHMVRYDFRDRYTSATETLAALDSLPDILADTNPFDLPPALLVVPDSISQGKHLSAEPADVTEPLLQPNSQGLISHYNTSDLTTADADPTETLPPTAPEATGLTEAIAPLYSPASEPAKPSAAHRSVPVWLNVMLLTIVGTTLVTVMTLISSRLTPLSLEFGGTASVTPSPKPQASEIPLLPEQQFAVLMQAAQQKVQQHQYSEALKLYDEAIALNSKSAEAYAGRCDVLSHLNRAEEAIVACDDALAFQPNFPAALWGKGNALMLQNRRYEALKLYETVTVNQPQFAPGWVKKGVALQKLGRSAEALVALDKGISLYRNSDEAWVTRGEALLNLRRYNDAIASFDKALQLQPDNAQAKTLRERAKRQINR